MRCYVWSICALVFEFLLFWCYSLRWCSVSVFVSVIAWDSVSVCASVSAGIYFICRAITDYNVSGRPKTRPMKNYVYILSIFVFGLDVIVNEYLTH